MTFVTSTRFLLTVMTVIRHVNAYYDGNYYLLVWMASGRDVCDRRRFLVDGQDRQ